MLWKTHVVGGLIAGALVVPYISGDLSSQIVFIACAGASALLPDIDSPESKLGRLLWPLSKTLELTAGHRGVMHSLLVPFVLFICLQTLLPSIVLPITIGYLSHLILDMLTPTGVPLLWPLSFHISLPLVQTGGIVEKILFVPLVVWCGVLIFCLPGFF